MSRYRALYDEKGLAYEYSDGELVWARSDLAESAPNSQRGPTIMGDLPDFVSPIDGTVISGRAQLREHCLKHNVVPTADLKGLPPRTTTQEYHASPEYREATKRAIAEIMNSKDNYND